MRNLLAFASVDCVNAASSCVRVSCNSCVSVRTVCCICFKSVVTLDASCTTDMEATDRHKDSIAWLRCGVECRHDELLRLSSNDSLGRNMSGSTDVSIPGTASCSSLMQLCITSAFPCVRAHRILVRSGSYSDGVSCEASSLILAISVCCDSITAFSPSICFTS